MESSEQNQHILAQTILVLEDEDELMELLKDLTTEREFKDICNRIWIAYMLDDKKTFLEIESKTHSSSATIARVSHCLKNGKGYKLALDRLKGRPIVEEELQETPVPESEPESPDEGLSPEDASLITELEEWNEQED